MKRIDLMTPDEKGETQLHRLAGHGGLRAALEELRAAGEKLSAADFLVKNARQTTPLYSATLTGCLDEAVEGLKAFGEKFSMKDFLAGDIDKWTPLHAAVLFDHLDQVVAALDVSGEKLTAAPFLVGDYEDYTPLDLALQKNGMTRIFMPAFWKGAVGEMITLWQKVPQMFREQIDYPSLVEEAIQLSVAPMPKVDRQAFIEATHASAWLPPEIWTGKEKAK